MSQQMIKKLRLSGYWLFAFIVLSLFSACKRGTFYEKIDSIDQETWDVDSVLYYEIDITDSLQFYDMYIHIRNTIDFRTQYFYVFMTTEYPNGYTGKDTLGFVISDPYGKWTGTGTGRIKDNLFLFKPKVRFVRKGVYKISVIHGMREKRVTGITDFGIRLDYHSEK